MVRSSKVNEEVFEIEVPCSDCSCLTQKNFCTKKEQLVKYPSLTTCRDPKPRKKEVIII